MRYGPPRHFEGCGYYHYPGPCPNIIERMKQRLWKRIAPLLLRENGHDD